MQGCLVCWRRHSHRPLLDFNWELFCSWNGGEKRECETWKWVVGWGLTYNGLWHDGMHKITTQLGSIVSRWIIIDKTRQLCWHHHERTYRLATPQTYPTWQRVARKFRFQLNEHRAEIDWCDHLLHAVLWISLLLLTLLANLNATSFPRSFLTQFYWAADNLRRLQCDSLAWQLTFVASRQIGCRELINCFDNRRVSRLSVRTPFRANCKTDKMEIISAFSWAGKVGQLGKALSIAECTQLIASVGCFFY